MEVGNQFSIIFKNRFLQSILLSALFLQIGIWVRNFSIIMFVMEQTKGDAFAISMISVAEYLPIFLFSFIGGTFADRWKPKRTMIWCDVLSAVSVFFILITLFFGTWKVVFFATLVSAILSQFSQPSGLKLFKIHLEEKEIQLAMSMYQTIHTVFMVFGPILGTIVFQKFGLSVAILITGACFLLSALALMKLPKDPEEAEQSNGTTIREEMLDGVRYVMARKPLVYLGLCFLTSGLGQGLIQPLHIFLVTEKLQLHKEYLQWLLTCQGVGMVVGGTIAVYLSRKISTRTFLIAGILIDAVGISLNGFSTQLSLTLVAQFIVGLALPSISIGINTMILKNTEKDFIGRVNGVLLPMYIGSTVVMMGVAGTLKQGLSLVTVYEIAAILAALGALFVIPIQEGKDLS